MRHWIFGVVGAALLAGCGTSSQQDGATAARGGAQEQVTASPAGTVAVEGPVYLDVRTPEEYAAGHVAGTLHIPLDQLERRWEELAQYRDQPMVVYCRTGRRSAAAIDILRAQGFTRLENGGGLAQMAARGVAVEPEGCC
jgi:phage shock protein E